MQLAVGLDLGRARADSKIILSIYTGGTGGEGRGEGSAVGKAIKKTTAERPRHSVARASRQSELF